MNKSSLLLATTLAAFASSTAAYAGGCPVQASGVVVTPTRGQVTATGYSQFITIQNGRQKLVGPAYLILNDVSAGATLVNHSGYTDCGTASFSRTNSGRAPFLRIYLGPTGTLNPNQSLQVLVTFNQDPPGQVFYSPTLILGHLNGHGVTWGDYDGDGKADRSVLGNDGVLRVHYSGSNNSLMSFPLAGQPGDIPIAGDFDGDGRTDPALYRPSAGEFFIAPVGRAASNIFWGTPGVDKPVIGDYDGDGKSDPAVYDKTTGDWKILRSTAGPYTVNWGVPNVDIPAPGDYDGDGVTDIAVYRPTTAHWYIILSSTQQVSDRPFGYPGEQNIPVVADYDGDGKADLTLLRQKLVNAGNGKIGVEYDWMIFSSESNGIQPYALQLTTSGWCPADYDGNGQADLSYFVVNGSSSYMYTTYLIPGLWSNVHETVTLPELGDGWPALALFDWYH